MATSKSRPRSRKRRNARAASRAASSPPRVAQAGAGRKAASAGDSGTGGGERASKARAPRRGASPLGAYGERPASPFGGLPVSELAILAGGVALVVGVIRHGGAALVGGMVLCLLGVAEVTSREHFSGYRSHTVLLAAIPAVVAEFVIVLTVGTPRIRLLLLVPVAAVFALCVWFLRRRFLAARQRRLATPAKR